MEKKKYVIIILLFFIPFIFDCTGCATKKATFGEAPPWVGQGPEAAAGYGRTSVYGAGSVDRHTTNHGLKRMMADERARVDLAKRIHDVQLKIMEQALAGFPQAPRNFADAVAMPATEQALKTRRVIERYEDQEKTLHALAGVDMQELLDALLDQARAQAPSAGLDPQALSEAIEKSYRDVIVK